MAGGGEGLGKCQLLAGGPEAVSSCSGGPPTIDKTPKFRKASHCHPGLCVLPLCKPLSPLLALAALPHGGSGLGHLYWGSCL